MYFGALPAAEIYVDEVWINFHYWVLGDRLLAPEYKNAAMYDLYRTHSSDEDGSHVLLHEIEYSWKHTTDESALRRFTLDLVLSAWIKYLERFEMLAWVELFGKVLSFGNDLLYCVGSEQVQPPVEDYIEETEETTYD
ncbi:hypothetical protein G6011_11430 [Alternaria panax]|uniref:Uncharacterized protein n=1 Tax=Alternaria panax TaxID=48097 RepID=A0AAD4NPW8_9PLEO|nr:hypothetical protein G6011_11430 [Alternaria panax]